MISETKDYQRGLTHSEVLRSRQRHGSNVLTQKKTKRFFHRFLSNLNDPIIRILLGAMVISALLLLQDGCLSEVLGIAVAILVSTTVSTLSECGSERAFQRLQAEGERVLCTVLRDGHPQSIPVGEVVVGDVVLLEAGERVAADGYLFSGEVGVDLSSLNGESREVQRIPSDDRTAPLTLELPHGLLRGSSITSGKGKMYVTRVGDQTLYGSMAQELQQEEPESPLKSKLSHFAKVISRIGYLSAALVTVADIVYSFFLTSATLTPVYVAQNLIHALTLGITVIVMAVPEGLPMMITVVLSANMRRMLRSNVLVRRGVGIETAGGIRLLFSDKTGTLTCGTPQVRGWLSGDGTEYTSFARLSPSLQAEIAQCAVYSADVVEAGPRMRGGNTTDRLLWQAVSTVRKRLLPKKRIAQRPFCSEQRYSSATVTDGKSVRTYYKGAPELLLPLCDSYADANGSILPLTQQRTLTQLWQGMARRGARMLVLATAQGDRLTPTAGLTLLAMVRIEDPVRREAKEAVRTLQRAGVQTVMITGDHPDTAAYIARECGILSLSDPDAVVSGEELRKQGDAEIAQRLPKLRVIARALPGDKSRLVRIAQAQGLVVGMTGDGLNDAPALKAADVGFAMGNGTEVTKEAADVVILDSNIASITRAVLFGRTIFRSIRKFITFQLTMNFCAVLVSMIAPFIGVDTPITVMQMLWINLIMDTLAGLAFAGEMPDPTYLHAPPLPRHAPVLTKEMGGRIAGMGSVSLLLCLATLKHQGLQQWLCPSQDAAALRTVFFTLFVFCGVFCAFCARSERVNVLFRLLSNPLFLWIMGAVMLTQVGMVYLGGSVFRTVPLTIRTLWRTGCLAALILPAEWLRRLLCALFLSQKE